jgi:hypothetical protein
MQITPVRYHKTSRDDPEDEDFSLMISPLEGAQLRLLHNLRITRQGYEIEEVV